MRVVSIMGLGLSAVGCGDFRDCSDADVSAAERLPEWLSEAGLYADIAADEVVDDAIAYTPRFPLWTDGASKRRWLLLPAGAAVDTREPDAWRFPVGTRAFKEFVRDGAVVETRMLRHDAEGWTGVAYRWADDGTDAVAVPAGEVDARGTPHDVPAAAECMACHGGRSSVLLGFSAVQLDPADRSALYDAGVLTDPVSADPALDAGPLAGLGVLHANCSHCHNPDRDDQPLAAPCYRPDTSFDLTLPVGITDLPSAPAVQTGARELGKSGNSKILDRMGLRNTSATRPSMPPLGTERVDRDGLTAVEGLVEALR